MQDIARKIVEIGHRLWQRGLVSGSDGNISVRLDGGRLLVTPSGVSKGFLDPDRLLEVDLDGNPLPGGDRPAASAGNTNGNLGDRPGNLGDRPAGSGGRPSSELAMHLQIYRRRPEIGAVVHAHPPVATAFASSGQALDSCLLSEAVLLLGTVPLVPFATPSTEEVPRALEPYLERCDAVLLQNHGAVTWAADLETAWMRMETVETTAQVLWLTRGLGGEVALGREQVESLMRVRRQAGLSGPLIPCRIEGQPAASPPDEEALVELVTSAVLEALGDRRRGGEGR
ncbi:MAG: class II aldolase/adducin family protein [Deltaproteobacteria bacterium]|nr:MAG: class II aldolase/adducin family protein [Deltaproteobacteria bacterium]